MGRLIARGRGQKVECRVVRSGNSPAKIGPLGPPWVEMNEEPGLFQQVVRKGHLLPPPYFTNLNIGIALNVEGKQQVLQQVREIKPSFDFAFGVFVLRSHKNSHVKSGLPGRVLIHRDFIIFHKIRHLTFGLKVPHYVIHKQPPEFKAVVFSIWQDRTDWHTEIWAVRSTAVRRSNMKDRHAGLYVHASEFPPAKEGLDTVILTRSWKYCFMGGHRHDPS